MIDPDSQCLIDVLGLDPDKLARGAKITQVSDVYRGNFVEIEFTYAEVVEFPDAVSAYIEPSLNGLINHSVELGGDEAQPFRDWFAALEATPLRRALNAYLDASRAADLELKIVRDRTIPTGYDLTRWAELQDIADRKRAEFHQAFTEAP